MRLSNYYKCFFRKVFLNIVLVREAVSVLEKKPASQDGCRCFRALLKPIYAYLCEKAASRPWLSREMSVREATAILVHGIGFVQWTKLLEICPHR
jgi:hypothetical protein